MSQEYMLPKKARLRRLVLDDDFRRSSSPRTDVIFETFGLTTSGGCLGGYLSRRYILEKGERER